MSTLVGTAVVDDGNPVPSDAPPSPAPEAGPRSELRTLRLLTGIVGATTFAATITTSFVIAQPDRLSTPGWFWALTVVAIVLPVVAAGSARWSDVRTLRRLNAVVVVQYGVLLVAMALAAVSGRVGGGEVPWLLTFTATPVAAALVAWGRVAAWMVLLGGTAAIQTTRVMVGYDSRSALASDVQAFFASVTLVLLFGTLIGASREFDRSTATAYDRASRRAAEDARSSVRRRLQALVHDELLATLALASQHAPGLRPAIAAQAARARQLVREMHAPDPSDLMPVDDLVDDFRTAVAQEAPDARFELSDTRTSAGPTAQIGIAVAEALQGALRQALTNSRTHAGSEARRWVRVAAADEGLRVVVSDDGVGFDPERTAPNRMGISSSIVGRLRGLSGGDARVESRPGAGTRVTLRWTHAEGWTGAADPAVSIARSGILPTGDRLVRRGLLVAIGAFWVAQAALAAIAGVVAGDVWVASLALGGVAVAFLAIGWSSLARPGTGRAWLVVTVVVATTATSLVPVHRDPLRYGDTWYIAACAFVLIVLAVRGRPGVAISGGVLAVALAMVGARIQANDAADVLGSSTRHFVVLTIGVLLVLGIARVQARTAALRVEELQAIRAEAFRRAAGRELRDRSRALEDLTGPLLEQLGRGAMLTAEQRRECAALEGRLRDQYRGGRIARMPMIEAAMAARRRGVDVVLLDDAPDRALSEAELDAIARWLADRLDSVPDGRFTGRILPAGRGGFASAVAGEHVAELDRVS